MYCYTFLAILALLKISSFNVRIQTKKILDHFKFTPKKKSIQQNGFIKKVSNASFAFVKNHILSKLYLEISLENVTVRIATEICNGRF